MNHKERCKELKEIRRITADSLGIDLHQRECTFEGECSGTCPRCAMEEKILNAALLKKTVAVAGFAAIASLSLTACNPLDNQLSGDTTPSQSEVIDELAGDVDYYPDTEFDSQCIDGPIEGGLESEIESEVGSEVGSESN